MSYASVSDTHVNALLTAAVAWTRAGLTAGLNLPMRQMLDLSALDANRMGLALLLQNRNTAVYGGDPEDFDDDEVAAMDLERDDWPVPTSFVFEALPGMPSPEAVVRLLECYRYQSSWEGEGLASVAPFFEALETCALIQLGDLDMDAIKALPRFVATPWLPDEENHDMFVRQG